MLIRRLARQARLGCVIALAGAALAAGRGSLTTAELLIDLARDHGLNHRTEQGPAVLLHVKALLRAAARVDPRLPDSYMWLYELAALGEDSAAVLKNLERLIATDPGHQTAFARWLDANLADLQTVEKRVDWLRAALSAGQRPPEQLAMVHVRLASLLLQSVDRTQARLQIDRAVGLDEYNPEAAALNLQMLDTNTTPATRLRLALRALRLNPFQVELAWQVGLLLDEQGMTEDAALFFDHAFAVHQANDPNAPAPAVILTQRAANLISRGRLDEAMPILRQAADGDDAPFEAKWLMHWLLTRQKKVSEADDLKKALSRRFAEIREPADWPLNDVAQAAWFYCTIDPQPQRALMLAEAASRGAPDDRFVTRVLGWALALNLKPAEAERTLMRIAGRDAFAAYRLAKLARDAGDKAAASRLIANLDSVPRGGPAFELLAEFGPLGAASQPAAKRTPDLADALADFDRGLLSLPASLQKVLIADVALDDQNPDPGTPWWASFTLSNKAHFPITLGPDGMVNPVFLLSFKVEGARDREYPHLMTVSVDRVRVLRPGQTVRVRRTLDVGPLRKASRFAPQQLQRVSITAILDPQQLAGGQWGPSMTGQRLRPVYFNRLPARTGREEMNALFAALGGESNDSRFAAIELAAELLGEKQRAELKQLPYSPDPVPSDRIYQFLLNALGSDSWELRARALDAAQVIGLDAQMIQAVQTCAENQHWLVRMLSLRLLARQGDTAAQLVKRLADRDPDETVRDLAHSFLIEWGLETPASQPASREARPVRGG